MDKRKITVLVLLDLSKAFDSINHERLLQKIAYLVVSSASVQWFKSYLSNLSQSVCIHSILSDSLPLSHGIPHGAILSPLLFCIYRNDLSMVMTCKLESYVDVSKLYLSFSVSNVEGALQKLQNNLHGVATWCTERQQLNKLEHTPSLAFLGELKSCSISQGLGHVFRPQPHV